MLRRYAVQRAGSRSEYLESQKGVDGTDWNLHGAWLLLNEARESYWDKGLSSGF